MVRTVDDVTNWREAAAAYSQYNLLGDDPVGQMFVRYAAAAPSSYAAADPAAELLACHYDGSSQTLTLHLGGAGIPLEVAARPRVNPDGSLQAFGLVPVDGSVWSLEPSLNLPGQLHAFVIVYGVPAVAPWAGLQPAAAPSLILGPDGQSLR